MNLKMAVSMMLGILGVLLAIVSLQGVASGDWNIVAQSVAPLVVMIAFIGFAIIVVISR